MTLVRGEQEFIGRTYLSKAYDFQENKVLKTLKVQEGFGDDSVIFFNEHPDLTQKLKLAIEFTAIIQE